MEAKLVQAILLADRDAESAKGLINKEVHPKNLEMSGINPIQDVHKLIWSAASSVLRNKPVDGRTKKGLRP